MSLPQVVLDTNVLIAAMRSRTGASWRLLELLASGSFQFHLSVPLVFEYQEVLLRELADDILSPKEVDVIVDYICSVGIPHQIQFLWRPTLSDPDDEFVLELAVAAGVEYIVTHNIKDLLYASSFGIKVVTPGQFLRILESKR